MDMSVTHLLAGDVEDSTYEKQSNSCGELSRRQPQIVFDTSDLRCRDVVLPARVSNDVCNSKFR